MNSLRHLLLAALTLSLVAISTPASAQEADAKACLRSKVWDGYKSRWALRTMATKELKSGESYNYMVTFYPGKEYLLRACGDHNFADLDLVVYDTDGKVVARDDSESKEPELTFSSDKVQTYYIVLHARHVAEPELKGWAALAISHR